MSTRLLFQFCLALVALNIFFLASASPSRFSHVCALVSIMTHYFLLSTFAWTLVQSVYLYRHVVEVFSKEISKFFWKACLFAWGKPESSDNNNNHIDNGINNNNNKQQQTTITTTTTTTTTTTMANQGFFDPCSLIDINLSCSLLPIDGNKIMPKNGGGGRKIEKNLNQGTLFFFIHFWCMFHLFFFPHFHESLLKRWTF